MLPIISYRLQWIEVLDTRYKPGGGVVFSAQEEYSFGFILFHTFTCMN